MAKKGGEKETYDKIRLESNYDVLWENLRTFVRLKKEVGMENPLLNLSCIIQPENFEELCSIVEAGYNLGKIDLRFGGSRELDFCLFGRFFHSLQSGFVGV